MAPLSEADASLARDLAEALEPWFERESRDLSWRRTRDPYAIWVSEIMLQQTRVETVERYFSSFIERFDTVEALAKAPREAVLEAWSGLGYYRRARLLHEGARFVARELGGSLPSDADALRAVPGIGRYTAGAIASIAFDRPAALVDGNVARVMSRVRAIREPKRQAADAAEHWEVVGELLRRGTPRVLAQALMELGATVCTPKSPKCGRCPVRTRCESHRLGVVEQIPAPKKRVAQPTTQWVAVAMIHRARLLLVRRPSQGLLAGMWCLPLVPTDANGEIEVGSLEAMFGRRLTLSKTSDGSSSVRHVFTHRIWEIEPRVARPRSRVTPVDADPDGTAWIGRGERPSGGIPNLTEKILARLGY